MAHFAEIDENNKVLRVLVTDNNDPNGDEGYQWLIDNLGGRWIQTSYNDNFRNKYAGIGDTYREDLDVFITEPPFASWVLNESIFRWESPVQYPTDNKDYRWDEVTTSWVERT
ncbi:hypothetical protein uvFWCGRAMDCOMC203_040 [Freshwater phage uvFW-CGR-AMD-COM-C203]|jgi:hypothetical protein|nr:hypothetical protein uvFWCGRAMDCOMC203_040 [Freshwater phage uvFW-CGR-AMD-COM-C203]